MSKIKVSLYAGFLVFFTINSVYADETETAPIPAALKNNAYLTEAYRYANLAKLSLLEGDFEDSIGYSAEAVRYAELSDEYIRGLSRLTPVLAEAEDRFAWAQSSGAAEYYPEEMDRARVDLMNARNEKRHQNWADALQFALLVLEDLADIAAPPPKDAPPRTDLPPQPTQYKVRPWDAFGDCLWNIAGWFYRDPWKWTVLYEANKDRLPEPDNPNWIEIGMILDIPGIGNEERAGFWDSGRLYEAPPDGTTVKN
jgi:nucleoid-associated protein YgaU